MRKEQYAKLQEIMMSSTGTDDPMGVMFRDVDPFDLWVSGISKLDLVRMSRHLINVKIFVRARKLLKQIICSMIKINRGQSKIKMQCISFVDSMYWLMKGGE